MGSLSVAQVGPRSVAPVGSLSVALVGSRSVASVGSKTPAPGRRRLSSEPPGKAERHSSRPSRGPRATSYNSRAMSVLEASLATKGPCSTTLETLATAMGSTKQSELSASVSSRAVGPFAAGFANTGVTQMLAVAAHQQSQPHTAKRKAPTQPAATKRSRKDAGPQGAPTLKPHEALAMAGGDHAMAFGAMVGHAHAAMVPPGGFKPGISSGSSMGHGCGYSLGSAIGNLKTENASLTEQNASLKKDVAALKRKKMIPDLVQ